MSLLDDLSGKLGFGGGGGGADASALLRSLLDTFGQGGAGLGDLVRAFQEKGLGDIVGSWVGHGENLPISVDQITQGLGLDRLRELAAQAGVSAESAASTLSGALPGLIDKLTPDGKLPEGGFLAEALRALRGPR
jgi:uncharacterized protein YidB (DUF937 family)